MVEMVAEPILLNPGRRLVDEVVDWLCGSPCFSGRLKLTPEGARSLAHIMVVVPTAQSGRNLRLALARKFPGSGLLPPQIVQPMQLVTEASSPLPDATALEVAAAFQQYLKLNRDRILRLDCLVRKEEFEDLTARFALLDQLQDIWRILAGNGMLMSDVVESAQSPNSAVAKVFASDLGEEDRRWRQLAELERGFFDYLHERGVRYPTEGIRAAKAAAKIVSDDIEEIVLPALADPIKVFEAVMRQQVAAGKKVTVLLHAAAKDAPRFNEWGRPLTAQWVGSNRPKLAALADEDIVMAANSSGLAEELAADYPPLDADEDLPALGLCDGELYPDIAAAFLNRKYVVHNPERYQLVQSSLGRLMRNLLALYAAEELPWREFVAVFRSTDVLDALKVDFSARVQLLEGLDVVQNAYIPTVIPIDFAFPEDPCMHRSSRQAMQAFVQVARELDSQLVVARKEASPAGYLRQMLRWAFAGHVASGGADEKEFREAVASANDFLGGLESDFIRDLALTPAEGLALAQRGLKAAVYSLEPDSADTIKTEGWLELAWSDAKRMALAGLHEGKVPDATIGHPFLPDALREALGLVTNRDRLARDTWLMQELLAAYRLRIYVARTNNAGDICRPSRLLFLCDDAKLHGRVQGLFGDIPERSVDRARRVEWAMKLPSTVTPPKHYSPSAIDAYVKCPFTYLLKYGLGMSAYEDKRELEANDFGKLAHLALEWYARRQIAAGDDQVTDAREIRRLFEEEIFPELRAKYGKTTLNLDLQLSALEGRLSMFAELQAKWAGEGWRIRAVEHEVNDFIPALGFRVRGFVDRLDENINANAPVRHRVIDYKTWDEKKLSGRVYSGRGHSRRILSVQLPVYGRSLEATYPGFDCAVAEFGYLVFGKSADEFGFQPLDKELFDASLVAAHKAISGIGRNCFWPPGPTKEWKWEFAGLFVTDPETDLADSEWVRGQLARLEGEDG